MSNFSGGSTSRRLQRSRDQRMVAGVAGGLAEYVDVDPLLIRVLFAVLAVFGGVGVLLYAVGWLLLPDAREEHSIAESVIGRGRRGTPMAEGIVLAVIVIALLAAVGRGDPRNLALLAVVAVGGVLLYRHLQDRRQSPDSPPPPPPTVGSAPPPAGPAPAQSAPAGASTAGAATAETSPLPVQEPAMTRPLDAPGTAVLPTRPLPRGSLATESMNAVNRAAEQLAAERLAAEERTDPDSPWPLAGSPATPPPSPPEPRRRRSPLRRITISLTIVVVGLLIAIDRAGGLGLSVRSYLAVALGLIGAGLLVGARWGRARGLTLLGIPLTVALLIAASAPLAGGGPVGDRTWTPVTVGAVQHSYNVRAGTARLDLDQVDFAHAGDVRSRVQVGAGTIDVIVPPDVDVTVHGTADAGQLQLLGTGHAGLDVNQTVNDSGPDGPGGGHLDLTVQVGVGTVEVHRATA